MWLSQVPLLVPSNWQFVGELARVAAPGATIVIVTWCHRVLGPSEESLQPWEMKHLKKICDAYYLPDWCSTADYVNLLESLSLQVNTALNLAKGLNIFHKINKLQQRLIIKLSHSLMLQFVSLTDTW